jgi:predicted dehydrogenase
MKVGIIGSGLQCGRRIEALQAFSDDAVSIVIGNNERTLSQVTNKYGVPVAMDPKKLFENDEIEAVIVCTPPSSHYEYMRLGLLSSKKILVEKPIAKSSHQINELDIEFGAQLLESVRCGFNHRFHPGIQMAKKFLAQNRIGEVLFGRSIYGIAARPDYAHEWRSNKELAAGGQFMEQGSHQIDLFQWLIGPVESIFCKTSNNIFDKQELDDGGMSILSFKSGASAQLHTSLAQWHNRFEFEIYGTLGFMKIGGLGNTYGTETFEFGERDDFAPFNSHLYQFRGPDKSWILEWEAFKKSILGEPTDIGTIDDARKVMLVAEAGYKSNSLRTEVNL